MKTHQNHYLYSPPFGMLVQERVYTAAEYRFGYNGKEKDNEVKGGGNSLDFGARIYDNRLGRWNGVDPSERKYSDISPYHFSKNNPIYLKDIDGKDAMVTFRTENKKFFFVKWVKKTIVIRADYHYIDGQFNSAVLDAVKSDWNNPNDKMKVIFQGKKYNVEYDINFFAHDEGSDLKQFNGEYGQNYLEVDNAIESPELSYYAGIHLNMNLSLSNTVSGEIGQILNVSFSEEQKFDRQVSIISHGVGHNIGMIHDDLGVMRHQYFEISSKSAIEPENTSVPATYVRKNTVTPWNSQQLVDRIEGMTQQNREFWNAKTDSEGNDLKHTGISINKTEAKK